MHTSLAAVFLVFAGCASQSDPGDPGDPDADPDAPGTLAAVADTLLVEMGGAGELAVAANDANVDPARTIALLDSPMHGTATLDQDGVLRYQAEGEYIGDDLVHYGITNPDGSTASARVAIAVECATCALGNPITLAWDANAPGDHVLGFRMYFGNTQDSSTMVMVDDIPVDQMGFDPAAPSISYDAWLDLHLRLGDTACFRITAYNVGGESGYSGAACKLIDGSNSPMFL